ncbi:MAG TPA: ABC transporter permease [Blastocatellia bacterium]|jgi:putative ABC transport system permease protein|nr:ABC transporter permease [Blastocatellia bacterium]
MHIQEIGENVLMAFDTIRTHKVRSALTMLGVIGGTMTVIAISSFLTGLREFVLEQTKRFGPDMVFVTKYDQIGMRFTRLSQAERMRKNITVEDAQAMAELPSVLGVSPTMFVGSFSPTAAQIPVKYRGVEANRPIILGASSQYDEVRNVYIKLGRFFVRAEEEHKAQVAVIGSAIADTLYPGLDPIGKEVEIEGKIYQVIGVMEKAPGSLFGGDAFEDRQVIVPFETIKRDHPEIEDISVTVKAKPDQFGRMIDEITELMRRRRSVPADKPNDFGISTPGSLFEVISQVASLATMIVFPLSAAGLLVGGIGVMNIMLVSVTERTKEIGIRRAIGAKKADIIWQFLTEAITLTALGGVIGILIGWLISLALRRLAPTLPSIIPLWAVLLGFFVSCSVGLIFGLWPAIKAARLDPIEALRYE